MVVASGGEFRMWDLQSERESHSLGFRGREAHTLSFTESGEQVYVTTQRERFLVYDVESDQVIRDFVGPQGAVAMSPDGRHVVSCGDGVSARRVRWR